MIATFHGQAEDVETFEERHGIRAKPEQVDAIGAARLGDGVLQSGLPRALSGDPKLQVEAAGAEPGHGLDQQFEAFFGRQAADRPDDQPPVRNHPAGKELRHLARPPRRRSGAALAREISDLDGILDQSEVFPFDTTLDANLHEIRGNGNNAVITSQHPTIDGVEQVQFRRMLDPTVRGGHQVESEKGPQKPANEVALVFVTVPNPHVGSPAQSVKLPGNRNVESPPVREGLQRTIPGLGPGSYRLKTGVAGGIKVRGHGTVASIL